LFPCFIREIRLIESIIRRQQAMRSADRPQLEDSRFETKVNFTTLFWLLAAE